MDELGLASWNVRDLIDPLRTTAVCRWLHQQKPPLAILCLQELQGAKETIDFQLATLIPQAQVMSNATPNCRVGSAIVIAPYVHFLHQGVKGDGTFAWVQISTSLGPINIGFVYAPYDYPNHISLG